MALTVDIELGATIPFPEGMGFGNVRPLVRINEIEVDNPADPVEAQLERAFEVAGKVFIRADGEVVAVTKALLAQQAGQPGITAQLKVLEDRLAINSRNIKTVADQVKGMIPEATAAVKAKGAAKRGEANQEDQPASE